MRTIIYRLLTVIFLIIGCCFRAYSQTNASDVAYDRGVDLYGMRKYAEAIPFFQKADSLEKLDRLDEGSYSLYPMLWVANCYYKLGNVEKAREIEPYSYMLTPVDRKLTLTSDSLADIGYRLMQEGDLENALDVLGRCGEIEKSILGADAYYYANTLSMMAECYMGLGDYERAFLTTSDALKIYRYNAYDVGVAHCYELLGQICYMGDEGYERAYGYYQLAYDKYNSAGYVTESIYSLMGTASCKNAMEEQNDAYKICLEAQEMAEKDSTFMNTPGSYADLLYILMQSEYGLMMYEDAFKHSCEAKQRYEENIDEIDYGSYLHNELHRTYLSQYVSDCSHEEILREAHSIIANSEYIDNAPVWICTTVERLYYRCNPDNIEIEQRIALQRRLMKEIEDIEGYKSASYLEVLADIFNEINWDLSNTKGIVSLYYEIEPIRHEIKEMQLFDQVVLIRNIATVEHGMLNDPQKAITTLRDGIDLLKNNGWQYSLPYCQLLNCIAQVYTFVSEYYSAFEHLQEAMEVYATIEENYKEYDVYRSNEYFATLEQLITYYGSMGDYTRADECFEKIKEFDPDVCDKNTVLFVYQLSAIMRSSQTDEEKLNEMGRVCRQYLSVIEQSKGKDNMDYYTVSLYYSFVLIGLGQTEQADKLMASVQMYMSSHWEGSVMDVYAKTYYAMLQKTKGDIIEAERILRQVLPIAEDNVSVDSQYLITCYNQLVDIYASRGQYVEMQQYITKSLQTLKDILNTNFRSMSYNERSSLWAKFSEWFNTTLPVIAYRGNREDLDCCLYDGVLMSKGLLLNSEIELRKLIAEKGDEYSLSLYEELQNLYVRQKKATENIEEYSRLANEITAKGRELVKSVRTYGDYTENLIVSWEDVRGSLSSSEAAIEFIVAPISKDSMVYSALVLKQGSGPKRVNLFNQKELAAISADNLYTTAEAADLVWEPLMDELQGIKDIYFAPQGMLHSMAIEYLPTGDGGSISDKFNLFRLSSTKEKITENNKKVEQSAVLYGGLNYDADSSAVIQANKDIADDDVFKPRAALPDLRDIAQGLSYLQYALEEVEDIEQLYFAVNESCHSLKGNLGTEESFKHLSGTGKTLLHIATHGFFYTETDYSSSLNSDMLMAMNLFDNVAIPIEDKMLTRSGLFLTGANLALTHQSIPDNMEDGILTAQEISLLDFRDVDLVVLSACKSAMGELTGDGVFGLQRGFKKAGAHTLLMSLWNVDDRATKLLMIEFYKNWLGVNEKRDAMSKREAFLKAQEYLRTTEDGRYKDPKYWAAFVMLDGVE